ncbi:MAG: TIR domain-containing protein [Anaerolineaceae bacterium]|nr:TIR domain-containing protein [Anaerolineaceae bacterium]
MAKKASAGVGIFISYSHEDRLIAEMLAQRINQIGYHTWIDFAGIKGGDEWRQSIDEALENSSAFLILLTPESNASRWVKYELQQALDRRLRIIPLMIRKCQMPDEIEHLHYVDFLQSSDQAFNSLHRALLTAVVRHESSQPYQDDDETNSTRPVEMERVTDTAEVVGEETVARRALALVIEDGANYQTLLKETLEEMGLLVHMAGTRNQAAEYIREYEYDLITLDMMLGPDDEFGEGGKFLLEFIHRYQNNVPVVMITSKEWDKRATADFFVKDHIVDMLDKNPLDIRRLRGAVEKHLPWIRHSKQGG